MILTLSRLRCMVRAFEEGRVLACNWNHRTRLVLGLWYVLNPSEGEPLAAMRRGIVACEARLDGSPWLHGGYDETITAFYLEKIREFAISAPPDLGLLELANALLASELADPWRHLAETGCGGGGSRLAGRGGRSESSVRVPLFLWEQATWSEAAVAACRNVNGATDRHSSATAVCAI
jgi:hypothetical protein